MGEESTTTCSSCGRNNPIISAFVPCVAYSSWRNPKSESSTELNLTEEVTDSVRIWNVQLCASCLLAMSHWKAKELERRKRQAAKGAPRNIGIGVVWIIGLPWLWVKVFQPAMGLPVESLLFQMVLSIVWLGGWGFLLYGLFGYPYFLRRYRRLQNFIDVLQQDKGLPDKIGFKALEEVVPKLLEKLERSKGEVRAAGCPLPPYVHDRTKYPDEIQRTIGSRRTGGRRATLIVKRTKEKAVKSLIGQTKMVYERGGSWT